MKLERKQIIIIFSILLILIVSFYNWSKERDIKQNELRKKGVTSLTKGNFDTAIKDLEESTELNPKDDTSQRMLGKAYEAKGTVDKALESYEASLKANPKQPEVLYNAAVIYKSQGKNKVAIEKLVEAVNINKNFVAAKLLLGDLYKLVREKEKARVEYKGIVEIKPFGVDIKSVEQKLIELDK